jgi:hypothetical protein
MSDRPRAIPSVTINVSEYGIAVTTLDDALKGVLEQLSIRLVSDPDGLPALVRQLLREHGMPEVHPLMDDVEDDVGGQR